jgi:hypothetical protein
MSLEEYKAKLIEFVEGEMTAVNELISEMGYVDNYDRNAIGQLTYLNGQVAAFDIVLEELKRS